MAYRGRGGPPVPPSYKALVQLPPKSYPGAPPGHDRLDPTLKTGALDLELETVTALHIGSGATDVIGEKGARDETLVRDIVLRLHNDIEVPVIPGSSLKGAVRSIAEALAGGCNLVDDCAPCVICALFGHVGRKEVLMGRVGFDDAMPDDPEQASETIGMMRLPMAFQPRVAKGRRIYGPPTAERKAEVPYLVIPKGILFRTRLQFRNVSLEELGLLFVSCGTRGSFCLRTGGGKFANLGKLRIRVTGGALVQGYDSLLPTQLDKAGAEKLADEAGSAFLATLKGPALDNLELIRKTHGG